MGRSNGVREMLPDEQPRERMLKWGSAQLKTSELIAILLNTGTEGESVIKLSERILHEHGGLRGLTRLDLTELTAIHGVGPAKATRLRAALELANRVVALDPDDRMQISSPEDVIRLVGPEMAALDHEQLRVVLVDTSQSMALTDDGGTSTDGGASSRLEQVTGLLAGSMLDKLREKHDVWLELVD